MIAILSLGWIQAYRRLKVSKYSSKRAHLSAQSGFSCLLAFSKLLVKQPSHSIWSHLSNDLLRRKRKNARTGL